MPIESNKKKQQNKKTTKFNCVTWPRQCKCTVKLKHSQKLPAPCLSSSAAELVTDWDMFSTTSSRGSKKKKKVGVKNRHSHLKTSHIIFKQNQVWARVCVCVFLPLSGMMSLQGRAKGVIECWQTSAVKLPVKQQQWV